MADRLRADGHNEVGFVGTPEGVEARLASQAGLRFYGIPSRGFDRANPASLIVAVAVSLISIVRAVVLLRRLQTDVVVGFGGYVSLPLGIASVLLRRPLVLHEQNSVPGLANKVLSRWAAAVGVTYLESQPYLRHPDRAIHTGNPVRRAVLAADRESGRRALGVPEDAVMVLVFGGSRGARHINQVVADGRSALLAVPGAYIVHVAGREEVAAVRARVANGAATDDARYQVLDYIDDMGSALAASDLVIARAGATSIAEITALGRPSVLVPYPFATDDHQTTNARALEDAGGAIVFADSDLDGGEFIGAVTSLLLDAPRRATMAAASKALGRPDADMLVAEMIRTAGERIRRHQERDAR